MFSRKKIQFNLSFLYKSFYKLNPTKLLSSFDRIKTLFFCILFSLLINDSSASKLSNIRCPIEPSELAVEKFSTTYKDELIFFCCQECVDIFENTPELFIKSIADVRPIDSSASRKSIAQKSKDFVWNFFFHLPGISIIIICGLFFFTLKIKSLKYNPVIRNWKTIVISLLLFDICYSNYKTSREEKLEHLEDEIHSTTFLEYGSPLIPAISKQPASLKKVYYRGNDERNPALFNGGNYRTAEFIIDLCNKSNEPINYDSLVDYKNVYLRVQILKSPNTSEHFWEHDKMQNIYATSSSKKFHWKKDKVIDAVYLNKTEEDKWSFMYPLEKFSIGESSKVIKGIIYLCEKRVSTSNEVVGGRFHYAFQFDLKLFSNQFDKTSDLWMGPLYRKRSLRIWEIPEQEWLSNEQIPINTQKKKVKDPILIGIDK